MQSTNGRSEHHTERHISCNLLLCAVVKEQHSTAQHSTAQHSTAQHSTAQHSTAQHITAQHRAQHHTAQHSTGLEQDFYTAPSTLCLSEKKVRYTTPSGPIRDGKPRVME